MFGRLVTESVIPAVPLRLSRLIGTLVLVLAVGAVGVSARAACDCPWVGDMDADGFTNVLDMVAILDAILDNGPMVQDPNCPNPRVDYNADGLVDARDVAAIRYWLFFGGGQNGQDPCECETQPELCEPLVDPDPGDPANSVVVESRSIVAGMADARIAISLTNDVPVQALIVPLVAREITPGSFITSALQTFEDRLTIGLVDLQRPNQYANPDGLCPGGFATVTFPNSSVPVPVGPSPEGFLFHVQSIVQPALDPGTDATGSLVLTVDVTSTLGSFEIDTTCIDPNTHLLFVQDDQPTNSPIVPSFTKGIITIAENTPPVALCQDKTVSVDNDCADIDVSVDAGSYDPDGGSVTITQDPPGPYSVGETVVTLTVEDDIGATAQCQATVTVEDNTPPEIVCPDDIYINIPPVYQGWVIAYEVTATDNCEGEVTIDCSHPSGGFFPTGTTEVTCTATDASGNPADCSFFVTVEAVCYDRLSDVNCDGFTDALDLSMLIDIIYLGGAPAPPCTSPP